VVPHLFGFLSDPNTTPLRSAPTGGVVLLHDLKALSPQTIRTARASKILNWRIPEVVELPPPNRRLATPVPLPLLFPHSAQVLFLYPNHSFLFCVRCCQFDKFVCFVVSELISFCSDCLLLDFMGLSRTL
jgi:hypothetical protein